MGIDPLNIELIEGVESEPIEGTILIEEFLDRVTGYVDESVVFPFVDEPPDDTV